MSKIKIYLNEIEIEDLVKFVESRGWKSAENIGDKARVYKKKGTQERLLVPLRKNLRDYNLRLNELLQKIKEFYSLESTLEVINRINVMGPIMDQMNQACLLINSGISGENFDRILRMCDVIERKVREAKALKAVYDDLATDTEKGE